MLVNKTVTCIFAICLGLVVSWPNPARADNTAAENAARTAVQKHNLKQSRRDMKRMQKQQKKSRQAAARKSH